MEAEQGFCEPGSDRGDSAGCEKHPETSPGHGASDSRGLWAPGNKPLVDRV